MDRTTARRPSASQNASDRQTQRTASRWPGPPQSKRSAKIFPPARKAFLFHRLILLRRKAQLFAHRLLCRAQIVARADEIRNTHCACCPVAPEYSAMFADAAVARPPRYPSPPLERQLFAFLLTAIKRLAPHPNRTPKPRRLDQAALNPASNRQRMNVAQPRRPINRHVRWLVIER